MMADKAGRRNPFSLDTPLPNEVTLTFKNPADVVRVLSPARRRILEVARERPLGLAQLARRLKRDPRAVGRDVNLLEKKGLTVDVGYHLNPGHGFRRVIRPAAKKIHLIVTV
jgi:DNA-binding transcriptional ArsR family regulator